MAFPFSNSQAKKLIRQHTTTLDTLGNLFFAESRLQLDVKVAVGKAVRRQVLEILAEIPVEEINRGRAGIRVKLLRENRYDSLADLVRASQTELESIKGIGKVNASRIKEIVDTVEENTRKTVRFRLSYDAQNPETTEIIRMTDHLLRLRTCLAVGQSLHQLYNQEIREHCACLSKVVGVFRRWLSSPSDKKSALISYQYLTDILESPDYGKIVEGLLPRLKAAENIPSAEAWEDFRKDSISFISIIDEILPDVMGGDIWYGLPQELAASLKDDQWDFTGLNCRLRKYQSVGVSYILHQKRVLLGDEMGLGKTIQAIAVMTALRNAGHQHFLVICPASVISNWYREIVRFSDLPAEKVYGPTRLASIHRWQAQGGVAITNYENLPLFFPETQEAENIYSLQPEPLSLDFCIIDEAQYIKNPAAHRSIFARKLCQDKEYLLLMTGTPLENRLPEMISLIELLRPDLAEEISDLSCISDMPHFAELLTPVYYRRKRKDVLPELPDLLEYDIWCTMGPEEEAIYAQTLAEKNLANIRRVSWNIPDLSCSSKATRMLELLEKAKEEDRKVLVFSYFLDTLEACRRLLAIDPYKVITGSVSADARQNIIDEFEAAPGGSVLLSQVQSGGIGLNIQSASVVIFCEPQLKPSLEKQALSRAYRMGQARNVLVYHLLADDTVDERIYELLKEKQELFDQYADRSIAAELEQLYEQ